VEARGINYPKAIVAFLGFGGEKVSAAETATLDRAAALG
jgi:hypothetical protein